MAEKIIYLTDRSAAETDDTCGMKFWLNRKEGGRGIVPKAEPFALLIGREIHEDFATLAEMVDLSPASIQACIDGIISPLSDDDKIHQRRMEILYRRLGWIAAWALFMEPKIREIYENVSAESEIVLDRDPLYVAVTPDRILRHRKGGYLIYMEYKTTISASKKWLESWLFQIQMHTSLAAVSEELNEKVKFAQVVGLMKGYESHAEGNRLMHPYVWAYYNEKEDKWEHEYTKARGSEWKPMPVWEYPGGVVGWVLRLGEEVARNQFPNSPPIFLNEMMLNDWVSRRTAREQQVEVVKEVCRTDLATRNLFFPKITRNCRPAFGDPCPYLLACWNAEVAKNPLNSTDYVERTPHHELEIIGLEM